MDVFCFDRVSWEHSQVLYHALAHLRREAFVLLRPATPYVCIGFHQDAEQEVDLEFTRANGIPVFRRETGGGAVYLDDGQLFYQLVLRRDHPQAPAGRAEFFGKFLQPVAETFREFGVAAQYKLVNDIVVNGCKISGNGAAEIEGMAVLVGNFILDFDYKRMSQVLRVPDEKFRDKVYKTLQENLTTIRHETGWVPPIAQLEAAVVRRYELLLGPLAPRTSLDAELEAKATELVAEMNTPEWLFANDRRRVHTREVKIREGVYVVQNVLKTPGGLIRATSVKQDGHLRDVHLSGDLFFYPASSFPLLERALEGLPADQAIIAAIVQQFYRQYSVESPGVQPEDLAQALVPTT